MMFCTFTSRLGEGLSLAAQLLSFRHCPLGRSPGLWLPPQRHSLFVPFRRMFGILDRFFPRPWFLLVGSVGMLARNDTFFLVP